MMELRILLLAAYEEIDAARLREECGLSLMIAKRPGASWNAIDFEEPDAVILDGEAGLTPLAASIPDDMAGRVVVQWQQQPTPTTRRRLVDAGLRHHELRSGLTDWIIDQLEAGAIVPSDEVADAALTV